MSTPPRPRTTTFARAAIRFGITLCLFIYAITIVCLCLYIGRYLLAGYLWLCFGNGPE